MYFTPFSISSWMYSGRGGGGGGGGGEGVELLDICEDTEVEELMLGMSVERELAEDAKVQTICH